MLTLVERLVSESVICIYASWVTEEYVIPLKMARQNGDVFLTWMGGSVGFGARIGVSATASYSPLALSLMEELMAAGYHNITYVGSYHKKGKQMYLIDFAALKRRLNMIDVFCEAGFRFLRQKGDQYRGPCVLHGSSPESTSFSMNCRTGAWQCFRCKEHGGWLDFYMKASKISNPYQAAKRLAKHLKIEIPYMEVS
jgi:CHC2 zinc finger